HTYGAAVVGGCVAERRLGRIRESNLDAGGVRLLGFERRPGLSVFAAFELCRGDLPAGRRREELLVPLQRWLCLLSLAETNQDLAEVVVGGRMIGLERNDFLELLARLFELARLLVCAAQLEAHSINGLVDVLGDLEFLDRGL